MLMQRHKFLFPFEANNRLKGNKCVLFRCAKKINIGELLKSHVVSFQLLPSTQIVCNIVYVQV
jgi:hypothetical protein